MPAKAEPKPRAARLKVFRTAVGFHDAYVAAPSRKAALAAWGTDKDLFARGAAEEVVDPALTAEPLAEPGTVVRRLRSAPAELASPRLPKARPVRAASRPPTEGARPAALPAPRPQPPRPDNRELEEARRALAATQRRHDGELGELGARERELAAARRTVEERQGKELRLMTRKLAQAEKDYAARLDRWRAATESRK